MTTCVRTCQPIVHSHCGRWLGIEFHYVGWDQAASDFVRDGRLTPCPKCLATFPGWDELVEHCKGVTMSEDRMDDEAERRVAKAIELLWKIAKDSEGWEGREARLLIQRQSPDAPMWEWEV